MVFVVRLLANVYIFHINMSDALAAVARPTIFQLLRAMYGVPLKWDVHGATVHWCESAIPDSSPPPSPQRGSSQRAVFF